MKKILFRGKRLDNSEWIYGDLRQYSDKGICERELSRTMKVIPESVGQYTGCSDKNGSKQSVYSDAQIRAVMADPEYKLDKLLPMLKERYGTT